MATKYLVAESVNAKAFYYELVAKYRDNSLYPPSTVGYFHVITTDVIL
jgi:hypothetical protein